MPPAPKRSSQRRRRNKVVVERASSDGLVRGPELPGRHSAIGRRWWEALRRSGQAQWFQPSDWAQAELVVAAIDQFVKAPQAALLSAIHNAQAGLLVTEGDRRRLRLELEPEPEESPDESIVSELDEYRRRLSG